jgi:hypothetical protein
MVCYEHFDFLLGEPSARRRSQFSWLCSLMPAHFRPNAISTCCGQDPNLFADAIKDWHLPESRVKNCSYEYRRYQYAFRVLIDPYVDHALADAKRLLHFEPEWTLSDFPLN